MFIIDKRLITLALILCLCVLLWVQHRLILNLRAESITQAQTIEQQKQANQKLSSQLKEERQAVERQQQITNQIKKEAESKREKVKLILEHENAAKILLPDSVIEQLQQH